MTRAVMLDRPFSNMFPDQAAAWRLWFERMGLDEHEVPVPCLIVCDDEARTIDFPVVHYNEQGCAVLDADGDILRDRVILQLEAPALSFPSSGAFFIDGV